MSKRLAVVGAGMMGEALGRGLISSGWSPGDLIFTDIIEERLKAVSGALGVATASDAVEACEGARGVLLAVKPADAPSALSMIAGVVGPDGLVSIVAGMTTASIEGFLGSGASVVRAMPNTPASVGAGVTALAPGRFAKEATRELADGLFSAVGPVVWLDEEKLDAVTAISGSGPAYVFLFAEALVDAGVALGLPRDVASTLAFATIEGSGRMLRESDEPPAVLKAQVTSPGGTTAAALGVLEAMALRAALTEAARAAWRRSRELGK